MIPLRKEYFYSPNGVVILLTIFFFFIVTAALNYSYLHMPPIWDTISVFSPAIYLYENNFDLPGLLKLNGYIDGGPNMYSISFVNFMTYLFITISNGNPEVYLPALHFIQFLFSSIVLTFTFFTAYRLFGLLNGALIAIAVLFYPLFLVQTSYLYTEILGSALVICSIYSWAFRFFGLSAIFSLFACFVKSFGIVLVCSIILLFVFDITIPKQKKFISIFTMFFLMTAIEWSKIYFSNTSGIIELIEYERYLEIVFSILSRVPDLELFFLISLFAPIIYRLIRRHDSINMLLNTFSVVSSGNIYQRVLISVYLVPFVFIGFILTVPLSGKLFFPLLRYYVWVLPLMLIGAIYACKLCLIYILKLNDSPNDKRIKVMLSTLLIALIIFFMANQNGRYYPSLGTDIESFSMTERSFEYLDFYRIQRASVESLAESQDGLPIFVTRGEYYYLSSPLMGYVDRNVKGTFFILDQPYRNSNLSDFPDDFLLLKSPTRIFHGGGVVKNILANAMTDPHYSVSMLNSFYLGPYTSSIYRISKTGKVLP